MPLIFLWEVLGGLGLFILGMKSMSEGLQKLAGERLRHSLEKATRNRLTAAFLGSSLASLLQSSSAASILVMGFLNAGLISIYQGLGVLIGTGLGATIAIQFIAFKVSIIALPAVFFGVLLTFFSKKRKLVYLGNLLLGAGLVFLGLEIMEAGFSPISQNDLLRGLQNKFLSWRLSAVFVGAFLTFLIQSSSAVSGIVIAMTGSGLISYETGVIVVIGEVLGTSLVAGVATINGSMAAKRTALLYFIISSFSICIALLCFPWFLKLVDYFSPGEPSRTISSISSIMVGSSKTDTRQFVARHIANAHTLFSFFNVLVFLPLLGFLARSATVILPDKRGDIDFQPRSQFIDVRVMNTPTIALLQSKNEIRRMADITRIMFDETVEQFHKYDAKKSDRIQRKNEVLKVLQRDISTFLVELSRQALSIEKSIGIPVMLHLVNTLRHMGDLNETILFSLRRKKEDKINFSALAMTELKALAAIVGELVHLTVTTVGEEKYADLDIVASANNTIGKMRESMINNHIKRLTAGKCSVMAGLIYNDLVSIFSRIAEDAGNILEMEKELFDESSEGSN